MKYLVIIFLVIIPFFIKSQTLKQIDEKSNELCTFINKIDTTLTAEFKMMKIDSFVSKYFKTIPENKFEEVQKKLFYRTTKNCLKFMLIIEEIYPQVNNMQNAEYQYNSVISEDDIKLFKSINNFILIEANGEPTKVIFKNDICKFIKTNKTVTEYSVKWKDDKTFILTYVSSDDEVRKNMNIEGDKYVNLLLKKEDNYFLISEQVAGIEKYTAFKLYFKNE